MMVRSRGVPRLVLVLLAALVAVPAWAAEPFRFPEAKHGQGELHYRSGLPVVTVAGSPEEIGEQIAHLVGKPSVRLLNYPQEAISTLATTAGWKLLRPGLLRTGYKLLDNFPTDYRAEFEAFVKHTGFERDQIVLANTVFDQKHILASVFGCSAVLVEKERSTTGQPIFGRNMDYLSLGYLHQYSLITVVRPKGKHAFAAVGYPGTVGLVSGMNDAGLAIAALETTGSPKEEGPVFNPEGMSFLLVYRRILEECTTVEEAAKLLSSVKRTTTQNLAVCDKSGGAVLEYTPTRVRIRRADNGTCRCTNHFVNDELKLLKPRNTHTTLDRLAMLDKRCANGDKMSVEEIKQHLHAVHQGKDTLQSMIFEPAALRLHFASAKGEEPSSGQPYRTLDLAPLLKQK